MSDILTALPAGPLVDPTTELPTAAWRAFFLRLQTRTGGTAGQTVDGLQQQITTETTTRTSADANLSTAIQNEANIRANADALLLPLRGGSMTLPGTVTTPGGFGWWGSGAPVARPVVTGSRGGNAALASLLTALASYGLITDSSTP